MLCHGLLRGCEGVLNGFIDWVRYRCVVGECISGCVVGECISWCVVGECISWCVVGECISGCDIGG